ncbi:MAG: hypothetical protein WC458_01880 [Patescibacteria group bacterium]
MNDTKNDPLNQLFVSESQAINRQELAELLLPYTAIHKETKEITFTSQFLELKNNSKILILLAAIKARSLILPDIDDKISPLEIIKMEIIPEGSVKTSLKSLLDLKEIKSEKGRYYLPNYKIPQVVNNFKKIKQ